MCVTDLDPDLDITEHEPARGDHRIEGKYAGVAWGRLAERRDGQDDLDGQDIPKPVPVPSG
jgi:hypothetical protein